MSDDRVKLIRPKPAPPLTPRNADASDPVAVRPIVRYAAVKYAEEDDRAWCVVVDARGCTPVDVLLKFEEGIEIVRAQLLGLILDPS